jgi:serine/alanine adding enzyme
MGGPVVENNDKEIAEQLISVITAMAKKKAIYTQFRNLFDTKDYYKKYLSQGYEYQEHLNILINLEKQEDELWEGVHSKRKNEIRRARREGTYFEVIDSSDALIPIYTILEAVYKKAGLPLPEIKYFISIHHALGPDIFRIFTAKHDGKIIGAMYALCFNGTIFDWYAGANSDYLDKYPNDLIPWEVFLWGKQNGFKRFDFGGAGNPDVPYGVREYKKKFGGELTSFGRYEKINKPFFLKIARNGFYFLRINKKY